MKNFLTLAVCFSVANMALAYTYKCKAIEGDQKGSFREINLSAKAGTLMVLDQQAGGLLWKGQLDKTYRPRLGNQDYVRFTGRYVSGGVDSVEYTPWYLVEKDLFNGENRGYMKEQARGEGYFASNFVCWLQSQR